MMSGKCVKFPKARLRINPKALVFSVLIVFMYLIGGALSLATDRAFRLAPVSLLVAPLILVYGLRFNLVFATAAALVAEIALSGLVNGSSWVQILIFARVAVFVSLIYYLVRSFITTDERAIRFFRVLSIIGLIQLPIVFLQRFNYGRLPSWIRDDIRWYDFDFGTFNYKTDYALAFFLVLLIVFLLFHRGSETIFRYKWLLVFTYSVTVLLIYSRIMQVALIIVWSCFVLTSLKRPRMWLSIFGFFLGFTFLAIIIPPNLVSQTLPKTIAVVVDSLSSESLNQLDEAASGGYARGAVLSQFVADGVNWLGDGPLKYKNIVTRTQSFGLHGHFFVHYAEIGLLGLFLGYSILFIIAFSVSVKHATITLRVSWVRALAFMTIMLLSLTSAALNDIAVVFIYCFVIIGHGILSSTQNGTI